MGAFQIGGQSAVHASLGRDFGLGLTAHMALHITYCYESLAFR